MSPWTPKALESFPPFVRTIRPSAVGVIAAATSTQPSVVRPADAQGHERHHPGGDVADSLDLGETAEVACGDTEVEGRLAGLKDEANAEDDDRDTGDESDQESGKMHECASFRARAGR